MSDKCGKRCALRGCQRPDLHPPEIRGNKWCPSCAQAISDGAYVEQLCQRCRQMPAVRIEALAAQPPPEEK